MFSVASASVTHLVGSSSQAGLGASTSVGTGAGGGIGAEAVPGGGAAAARGCDDLVVGLLMQLLARFPPAVPQQAPDALPVAGAQQGAVVVQQSGAAVVRRPHYLEMMGQMQRISTPFFEGRVGPEEADEWRLRLEQKFRSIRCPEEYQVELGMHYLGGDAHLWWRTIEARRAVWTWGEFLAEFNAKYFPQEARDRLVVYNGRGLEDERAQVQRLLQGLRLSIRTQCRGAMYTTRADLVELAASIEKDLREQVGSVAIPAVVASAIQPRSQQQQQRSGFGSDYGKGGKPAQGQKRRSYEILGGGQSGRSVCFGCGNTEHRVASCPRKDTSREARVCFHCREPGHIRSMCSKL